MKSRNLKPSRLFIISFIWKFLPPSRCFRLKSATLRWAGAVVGKNVQIMSSAKFLGDYELIIGDNVFIGHEALIYGSAGSKVVLENHCKVASRAIIATGYHVYSAKGPCVSGEGLTADVVIKEGALVGTMAMVLPGKTLGKMSHVAAYGLLTHDTPDYVRVAGVPARIVKNYLEDVDEEA
jgi:acetyltransferase-like isoleucine patch superfamily enzyme